MSAVAVASGHPDTIDLSEAARADAFLDELGWFSARGLAEHGITLDPARANGEPSQVIKYHDAPVGYVCRPRGTAWFSAYNGPRAKRGVVESESHGHRSIAEAAAFIAVRANIEPVPGCAGGASVEERRARYLQHLNSNSTAALRHRIDPDVRERVRSALNGARALISLGQMSAARMRLTNASALVPPQHRAQRYLRQAMTRRRAGHMREAIVKAQRALGFDEYGTVDLEVDTPGEVAGRATFQEQGRWSRLHPWSTLRDPRGTYGVLKLARQPAEGRPIEVVPDTFVVNWGYWGSRSDKVIDYAQQAEARASEARVGARAPEALGERATPRWVAYGLNYEDAYELMEEHGLAVCHAVLVHGELNAEAQLAARRLDDGRYLLVLDAVSEEGVGVDAVRGGTSPPVWHVVVGGIDVPSWTLYDDPLPL